MDVSRYEKLRTTVRENFSEHTQQLVDEAHDALAPLGALLGEKTRDGALEAALEKERVALERRRTLLGRGLRVGKERCEAHALPSARLKHLERRTRQAWRKMRQARRW